jgi:hypothetical protein
MQLVEVSLTGVRSAVITFQRTGTQLRCVVFPMLHLGTPGFYQAVTDRLHECDVVVAEGVGGQGLWVRALTMAYRTPARSRRLGLSVQDIDLRALAASGVEVINADLSASEARRVWRSLPAIQRLAILCLVPIFGVAFRVAGTRRVLGRYLALEDLRTPMQDQARQVLPAATRLISDDRDQRLVSTLVGLARSRAHEPIAVGVLYGADHVIAVVRALDAEGYRPRHAEWLTVFDFDS